MVRVLPIHFDVVLRCKGGVGKITLFRSRKVVSGADIPNRAIGQIFHHARAWKILKVYFGMVSGCKGGEGKKNLLGPEQFFQVQAFQTELRAEYPTMPGLEHLFWRRIRL